MDCLTFDFNETQDFDAKFWNPPKSHAKMGGTSLGYLFFIYVIFLTSQSSQNVGNIILNWFEDYLKCCFKPKGGGWIMRCLRNCLGGRIQGWQECIIQQDKFKCMKQKKYETKWH